MMDFIKDYVDLIVLIAAAITPALTAIAGLISIIRNMKKSNSDLVGVATELQKELVVTKKLNENLVKLVTNDEELIKRYHAIESQVNSLRAEMIGSKQYEKIDT